MVNNWFCEIIAEKEMPKRSVNNKVVLFIIKYFG
jgi:hypothetical protein